MTTPRPRRTYVDQGIVRDIETDEIIMLPSTPWKPLFPRWVKCLAWMAWPLAVAASHVGTTAPAWLIALFWVIAAITLLMFFIDSVRRHPSAYGWLLRSVAVMLVLVGIRHAIRRGIEHERERMAEANADAFAKKFGPGGF